MLLPPGFRSGGALRGVIGIRLERHLDETAVRQLGETTDCGAARRSRPPTDSASCEPGAAAQSLAARYTHRVLPRRLVVAAGVVLVSALAAHGVASLASADAGSTRLVTRDANKGFSVSGDGSVVVVSSPKGNAVTVLDLRTGSKRVLRFRSYVNGFVSWPVTRDGRKVIYSTLQGSGDAAKPKIVSYDLRTNQARSHAGYSLGDGEISASGRYVAATKNGNSVIRPHGILDLKTRTFVRLPKPEPHLRSWILAVSGNGDWVIYEDVSSSTSKCYSFSRTTRQRHFLREGCRQQRAASPTISDDGGVVNTGPGITYDGRTGGRIATFPGLPASGDRAIVSHYTFNVRVSGDGSTLLVPCGYFGGTTTLYVVDRETGRFAHLASRLRVDVFHGFVLTADGKAVFYQDAQGIHEIGTTAATPVAGIPAECSHVNG